MGTRDPVPESCPQEGAQRVLVRKQEAWPWGRASAPTTPPATTEPPSSSTPEGGAGPRPMGLRGARWSAQLG